jgi:hypothetical protein
MRHGLCSTVADAGDSPQAIFNCLGLTAIAAVILLAGVAARSDDAPKADADRDAARQASAARLKLMRRRVMSLTAEFETTDGLAKAELIETPLLRYSNPAARIVTLDAAVWAWGRVGRPVALASVEESGCEIVSLADQAVSLTGKSGLKWAPTTTEIRWQIVSDVPPPADAAAVRARQMKEIAKGFSATGHYGKGEENLELRLLDRHLHRYANPEGGLIDGAIFAFVAGTNPEVILLLECRQVDSKRRGWFFAFARLSAGELEARRGNTLVWNCPAITGWVANAPYSVAKFGKEDLVPEGELPSDGK